MDMFNCMLDAFRSKIDIFLLAMFTICTKGEMRNEPKRVSGLRSFFMKRADHYHAIKRKKLLLAVYYLSDKIESGRDYTESEINDLLDGWTTFHDPAILDGSCIIPACWNARPIAAAAIGKQKIFLPWRNTWQSTPRQNRAISLLVALTFL